ncbi:MAG TPA: hypothetical protein VK425_04850 [Acidimicrobiales bacterium]|nr:hypothetical protein [Acidimicrobiales bacterium]
MTPAPSYRSAALAGPRPAAKQENPVVVSAKRTIMAALRSYFNFLVLNLVLVLACLPVVTAPVAFYAATVALERWRVGGEDRVVREFISALRTGAVLRKTAMVGVPLAVCAIAAEEVHFFARGGTGGDWMSLGLGFSALVIALTSLGYVLLLGARQPSMPLTDLWSLSVQVALRNLFLTGPLFVGELAGAALLGLVDPVLVLIGLPLGCLCLLRLTAELGLRRAGLCEREHVR